MSYSAAVATYLLLGRGLSPGEPAQFAELMLTAVPLVTVAWLAVTFLTKPEPEKQLAEFFRRARPYRALWGPVASGFTAEPEERTLGADLATWGIGVVFLYAVVFLMGKLLLGSAGEALALAGVVAVAGWALWLRLR